MSHTGRKIPKYFSMELTNTIKGAAIILMLFHHMFTFPYWISVDRVYLVDSKVITFLNQMTKGCVPLFCFLTGYFYYYTGEKSIKNSLNKIVKLLGNYWFTLFLFLSISLLYGCHFSVQEIIKDIIGHGGTVMVFCWYILFFSVSMILLPSISRFLGKHLALDIFICVAPFFGGG